MVPFVMSALILTGVASMTTKSWLIIWAIMEINTTAMIMMLMEEWSKEKTIMFFIIQSAPSMAILLSITLKWNPFQEVNNPDLMIMVLLSMACKMGMFPFHKWILKMSKLMEWKNNFIMMTWQKVIPLTIIMKVSLSKSTLGLIVTSLVMMTMALLNATSMKVLFMASSMAHMSWMIMSTGKVKTISYTYLCIYSILLGMVVLHLKNWKVSSVITQESSKTSDQMGIKINIISLSGIPPLTGFFLKVMVIYMMVKYYTPSKVAVVFLVAAAGAFYAYSQTTIKMMALKPYKKKEGSAMKLLIEKSPIVSNLVLPLMVMV